MSYYCEMCGRELEARDVKKAYVEGLLLILCPSCYTRLVNQGKAKPYIEKPAQRPPPPQPQSRPRPPVREEYEVVEDYAKRIREARERLGWSQQVLANKARVGENVIKRIESGKLKPGLDLARRLEKILGIKLLEPLVDEGAVQPSGGDEGLTLGDLIRVNKEEK